jgi:RNA polymerase sigma-70 factor, ECF subfamily
MAPQDTPPAVALPPERQEEFVRLLNGAHALLLRYVRSLVVNRHDAEDVLQRASVVMWRRFATFDPGTDFVAWATTVAFYEARNFQRVTGRSRLAFDLRQSNLRMELLEGCVEKLEDTQRDLVTAIYVDGRDVGAVAEQSGRAPQTIYNKLTGIRKALAECVQQQLSRAAP